MSISYYFINLMDIGKGSYYEIGRSEIMGHFSFNKIIILRIFIYYYFVKVFFRGDFFQNLIGFGTDQSDFFIPRNSQQIFSKFLLYIVNGALAGGYFFFLANFTGFYVINFDKKIIAYGNNFILS